MVVLGKILKIEILDLIILIFSRKKWPVRSEIRNLCEKSTKYVKITQLNYRFLTLQNDKKQERKEKN